MTKKLFKSIVMVAIAVLFASIVLIFDVLYNYMISVQQSQMRTEAELAGNAIALNGIDYLSKLRGKDYRITWISATGEVLYDNLENKKKMENHSTREEVKEAMANGFGESTRYSQTLTKKLLYVAQKLPDGTIIRVSDEQKGPLILLMCMLQPIFIVIIITIILSVVLAGYVAKRVTKPLNEINLENPLENNIYDEIAPLLRRINRQNLEISEKEAELTRKREEFKVITSGLNEGLILLNPSAKIITMNRAALRIFSVNEDVIGTNFLNLDRSLELQNLLDDAYNGKSKEIKIFKNERIYRVKISKIVSGEEIRGLALLVFDVTDRERGEELRREFTANVSHELKTPLHMISGCAELFKNGLIRDEDKNEFMTKIYDEAQHLSKLVEDIISLSQLDEEKYNKEFTDINLSELSNRVIERLSLEAKEKEIKVDFTGETNIIKGSEKLIENLIYNLVDNAIKYNVRGGKVKISTAKSAEGVKLKVEDTGVGISPEDQNRIFERFYRVEKSRSREQSGTGLGLSLVKHICDIHRALIGVESTLGKGTTMKVVFKYYES